LHNRIFAPLGMSNTGYGAIPGAVLRGYERSIDGIWRHARPGERDLLGGEGGVYSTLDDMLIWSRVLRTGKILSATSQIAMLTDYGHNYGFGWRFSPKFVAN
jgi:D-alanyl-D-alanine carboxypeptidase